MTSVAFSNQKGGVGKTTLTRELGVYIARLGHPVLLVDADPQGNLTKGLTFKDDGPGLYEALHQMSELKRRSGEDVDLVQSELLAGEGLEFLELADNLWLLRGGIKLALLEKQLLGEIDAYTRFKELFAAKEFQQFQYLFIDTPPSLGALTINALTACPHLLIPISCRLYSLQGTNDLLATVNKVRKTLNAKLSILGVVLNAFEAVPLITRRIRDEVKSSFGPLVFGTALSKSIRLEEGIATKEGITQRLDEKKVRKAKQEVENIGNELLERLDEILDNEIKTAIAKQEPPAAEPARPGYQGKSRAMLYG